MGLSEKKYTAAQPALTPSQAWEKIKHYCAYQERCHSEVKEKLYGFGLHRSDTETLMARLIEENYLNEERFAIQYAGGHFRLKQWGKIKIAYALRQKFISDYCIKKALKEIAEEDYEAALQKLAFTKWNSLTKERPPQRWAKTRNYLLQKGFEQELVNEAIKTLQKEK